MDEELKLLYGELGYTGNFPGDVTYKNGMQEPVEPETLPPLDKETLRQIERMLKDDPEQTIATLRTKIQDHLSDDEIHHTFSEAQKAFDDPGQYYLKLVSEKNNWRQQHYLPEREAAGSALSDLLTLFRQFPEITVDPSETKYEPRRDALSWVVNSGVFWLKDKLNFKLNKAKFPYHDDGFKSNFVYSLKDQSGRQFESGEKIKIALFSDWGTGLYHSLFIGKHIEAHQPHYALHLGDVYYSGRDAEFKNHFSKPLAPIMKNSRIFALNANHEMYSGGYPYFAAINERLVSKEGRVAQEQEGSYFCLRNDKYQIIGIDTAFHKDGRYNHQSIYKWLEERLSEGRDTSPQRTNILLSANQPYEIGKEGYTALYTDLQALISDNLIDYWFWGNNHYAALFDRSEQMPFVGSCVGHGGHPIYRNDIIGRGKRHRELLDGRKSVPPLIWLETEPKFPQVTENLRPELGNHGYCMMELDDNGIKLTYYDWLNKKRYSHEFSL